MSLIPTTDVRSLLQRHELFGALDSGELAELLKAGRRMRHRKGQVVFAKDEPGAAMMAVLSGSVKISSTSLDGREIIYAVLSAGETFGEIALLDGAGRTADATAQTDCELLVLDRRNFLAFLTRYPEVAVRLLAIVARRLRRTDAQIADILFSSLRARLAKLLLELSTRDGPPLASGAGRASRISQSEIAARLGSARESVSRQLNAWRKDGIVAIENRAIAIRDADALRALAEAPDD